MTQPTPQLPPIQTATAIMQTPAGPLVLLQVSTGTVQVQLMMSDEQAGELARTLPAMLTEAAAMVRRSKLGLIVPGNGHATPPPNMKGL